MSHAQDRVFDLAINRAALVVSRLGRSQLAAWHSRTRFVARIPLEQIALALESRPAGRDFFWSGGVDGAWVEGKPLTP